MARGNGSRIRRFTQRLLGAHQFDRLRQVRLSDQGWGYDKFGLDLDTVALTYAVTKPLYEKWFRVQSVGHDNVPRTGRAILVGNHSGVVPIDGGMVALDILHRMEPPRLMRAVVDNFAARLPFINVWFSRTGQVIGTRKNFEELLENDELVMVFPEGSKGPGKRIWERYKLLKFNVGFMELSVRHRAPLIPVAIVGAEEQAPMLANLRILARMLNVPYFPVTLTFPHLGPLGLIPLPVRYRILYGPPLEFYKEFAATDTPDPRRIQECVQMVRDKIHDLIQQGLQQRKGIFV